MKIFKQCLFAAALMGLASSIPLSAQAAMKLVLDDGAGNSVTLLDNDGDGVINFNGALGVWTVNVTTGLSKPVLTGDPTFMDLNSVNVSGGVGTMTIQLTDTDFLPAFSGVIASNIGGTTNGTVDYSAYADATNVEFGTGTTILTGTASGGGFNDTGSAAFDSGGGAYSLTLEAVINHTNAGQITSFDIEIVPEPATLALLGIGLAGLGFGSRRKKKAA